MSVFILALFGLRWGWGRENVGSLIRLKDDIRL